MLTCGFCADVIGDEPQSVLLDDAVMTVCEECAVIAEDMGYLVDA